MVGPLPNLRAVNPSPIDNHKLLLTTLMSYLGCSGPRGLPKWATLWAALSWLLHMVAIHLCPPIFLGIVSFLSSTSLGMVTLHLLSFLLVLSLENSKDWPLSVLPSH